MKLTVSGKRGLKRIKRVGVKSSTKASTQEKVFFILVVIVLLLASLNMAKAKGWLLPEQSKVVIGEGNVISLGSLTLEQKIAQMIIVAGGTHNMAQWKKLQLGGIHMFAKESPEVYKKVIGDFQQGMNVPFFVTADLEGCINPLANFYNSTAATEIKTVGEAFQKGSDDGRELKSLGFSINFAPVVDLNDYIWKCRVFKVEGNEVKISELAEAYSLGLRSQGIIATAKHYPGKALSVRDPHKNLVEAEIDVHDIYPYQYLANKKDVGAFMVTHVIATGEVNSEGKPSVSSFDAVEKLKGNFSGLIITDDTMMLGLRKFYKTDEELYVDVFRAGNDLVLNFDEDPTEIYHMIQTVAKVVESGEISEQAIDESVRKILTAKGFVVVD